MAQNEATTLVSAALFSKPNNDSQQKATSNTTIDPPGLTLLKFWEGREPGAHKSPQSAVEVDQRLTSAIQRHIIDPALVPQILQPLRLGHDFIPRAKRILEQRTALEVLRLKLKTEGEQIKKLIEKQGDRSTNHNHLQSPARINGGAENGSKEEDDNPTTLSTSSDTKENISHVKVPNGNNEGLLRHPDVEAWERYETETLRYIAVQSQALDAHTTSLKETYQSWRREVDFFRGEIV